MVLAWSRHPGKTILKLVRVPGRTVHLYEGYSSGTNTDFSVFRLFTTNTEFVVHSCRGHVISGKVVTDKFKELRVEW